jgi:hypothetical protein
MDLKNEDDILALLADPHTRQALIVRIWPEAAQALITINTRNRAVVKARVKSYAEAIRANRFLLGPDAVGVDWDGNLVNSQHRLYGVIDADAPIEILLVTGLDPKVRQVVDIGRQRRLAETLAIEGILRKGNNSGAGAIKLLYQRNQGAFQQSRSAVGHDLLALYAAEHIDVDRMALATQAAERIYTGIHGTSPSAMIALLYQASELDPYECDRFAARVKEGANLQPSEPELLLRNWLSRLKHPREVNTVVHYATYVTAWNARRDQRRPRTVFWDPTRGVAVPDPH